MNCSSARLDFRIQFDLLPLERFEVESQEAVTSASTDEASKDDEVGSEDYSTCMTYDTLNIYLLVLPKR